MGLQFLRQCCVVYGLINLSEMMIYSVLSLFKWNLVCGMNENFFYTFLSFFDMGFILITQMTRWLLGALENPLYELMSGTFNFNMGSGIFIFWKVFITIIALILVIGGVLISYKKLKNKLKNSAHKIAVQPLVPLSSQFPIDSRAGQSLPLPASPAIQVPFPAWAEPQNYNNSSENNPLLNHLQMVIVFVFWVTVILTFIITNNTTEHKDDFAATIRTSMIEMAAECFLFIIFPVMSLSRKTPFRAFLLRELKSIFNLH